MPLRLSLQRDQFILTGHVRFAVTVYEHAAVFTQLRVVVSTAVVEQCPLPCRHVDEPYIALDRAALVGHIDDAFLFCIESQHIQDHPLATCKLSDQTPLFIEKIEMIIPVLLALHHELIVIPRQEPDRMARFNVLRIRLPIEFLQLRTRRRIV